jgi:acetyl esterase/lipase
VIWIAIPLFILGLLAAVPKTPTWLPGFVVPPYFMISLTGQLFALPLLIVSWVLAVIAEGTEAWLLAGIGVLFAIAHSRNRMAGRLLLDRLGLSRTRIPLLAGLAPPAVGDRRVRRIKDIAYGDAGERNLLDLVLPHQPPTAPMPILIHVHGGAWVLGAKGQQAKPLINHLVPQGWLCADINYRLGPSCRFPDMIIDVLKAIAWVKAHAHEYGGDPSRVAITGGSAGAQLAALAALAHDDPAFKPGFEDADCRVQMAVPVYGRFDMLDRKVYMKGGHKVAIDGFMAEKVMPGAPESCRDLWHACSPLDRIRPDAPPMLITHGTGDSMLPFEDARDFAEALQAVSPAPVIFIDLPGIEHAYEMASSPLTWAHVRAVTAFLAPLASAVQDTGGAEPRLRGERVLAGAG